MSDNAAESTPNTTATEATQNEPTTTQAAPQPAPAPDAQAAAPQQEPQQSEAQQADASASVTGLFDEESKEQEQQQTTEEIPENYTFSSSDGQPVPEEDVQAYTNVAKELRLSQDQAQRLFELSNTYQKTNLDRYSRAWAEQSKQDQEIGGPNLEQTRANVGRFLKEYATPEFKQLMKITHLENNPEILRVLSRAGARLSQDNTYINGNNHVSQKRDPYAYMTNSPELS